MLAFLVSVLSVPRVEFGTPGLSSVPFIPSSLHPFISGLPVNVPRGQEQQRKNRQTTPRSDRSGISK
jgi:hypothetical protein